MFAREKPSRLLLTVYILATIAILMPAANAQVAQPQDDNFEGDMTFRVFPDESVEMRIIGNSEWALRPGETPPPYYEVDFELINSPMGVNLTDVAGILGVKLDPEHAETLGDLDLDILVHEEALNLEVTILFNLPEYAGVDGRIGFTTDEATSESTLDLDLTVTIWYTFYPREYIEMFIPYFPMLKAEVISQVSEVSDGNLTVQDLTLVDSEIGPVSATLTLSATIVGYFGESIPALTEITSLVTGQSQTAMTTLFMGIPQIASQVWRGEFTEIKSSDLHINFDKEELAFTLAAEGVVEGDLDRQVNAIKSHFMEEALQDPYVSQEAVQVINDFFLPTNVSIVNLNTTFEYSQSDEIHAIAFTFGGLELKPPTPQALLSVLQDASDDANQPGFNLTLEGASDGNRYVEIVVPETTAEPILMEPRKVVWEFDHIENLSHVTFKVKTSTLSMLTPMVIIPAAGVAVAAAAGYILYKRK